MDIWAIRVPDSPRFACVYKIGDACRTVSFGSVRYESQSLIYNITSSTHVVAHDHLGFHRIVPATIDQSDDPYCPCSPYVFPAESYTVIFPVNLMSLELLPTYTL